MNVVTQFAAAESSGITAALGIDWQMLVFQIIGFVILVWLMSKYVYPPLINTIDKRQADIEAGNKAAEEAEKKASEAKAEVAKMMKKARQEASDIVETAKEEATNSIETAERKSKERADRIVADAHAQIGKDVEAAKRALHNETLELVALATEKVVGKSVDATVDDKVITAALKEAK